MIDVGLVRLGLFAVATYAAARNAPHSWLMARDQRQRPLQRRLAWVQFSMYPLMATAGLLAVLPLGSVSSVAVVVVLAAIAGALLVSMIALALSVRARSATDTQDAGRDPGDDQRS